VENLFRDEQKKVKKRKKVTKSTLSFAMDDAEGDNGEEQTGVDDESDGRPVKKSKSRKNPNVDTSFLPDREREEQERREREQLRQEWLRKQEDMKKEEIEITYSYWDGSGHRKSVMVSYGILQAHAPRLITQLHAHISMGIVK
jgi:protein FAM50